MAEGSDNRDTENNWVIPSTESLLVETVGAAHGELAAGHDAVTPEVPEAPAAPEGADTEASGTQEVKGTEPPPPITEAPPHQEQLEIPPEEPRPGLRRRVGADLEEVSCSSSDDDVEGLRKRTVSGAPPSSSVGAAAREAEQLEADAGSSLIINKCIIAAIALVGLALLIFTGGFGGEDESPQSVLTRSVTGGEQPPQAIADIQEWIHQHAEQFTGDPSSLQIMSSLLDKVAKENQEIRHMQATLQDQKEELETLLHAGDTGTPGTRLTEENVRLKDALLQEETGHLSSKEELQNLQEKLDALEADSLEKEALVSENSQLKVELETSKRQIESFLTQKETLVAESQMLRQELDKQRQLVASIRQDLESMTINKTVEEDEKVLRNRVAEMGNRLAMEAQRSESWEKKYVEHAQKRKEQVGEERKVHGHKEWKKGEKWDRAEEQVKKPHVRHGRDHGKRWEEEEHRESQHEEWKSKKHEDNQHWRDKKHRHSEDEKEHHPRQSESWKDKAKEHRFKDSSSPHHESHEKNWKDKRSHHHHRDAVNDFHPRKGQKEFSEAHKHGEDKRKEHGGKDHRHHDHNKFWKKLSDHQYRVPVGCSDLEDCARKDGIDLFNVELKPVERKQFEDVLKNYLAESELSKNLPDLLPLLDGFFEGPHFAHHKIRFKDFVDDVEDFLEDLARRETGNDDAVDDFERFVYISFFGDAAKKRSAKKDEHKRSNKPDRQHNPGKPEETPVSSPNQTNPRYHKDQDNFKEDTENDNYKPYKARHDQDKSHDQDRKAHRWKKQNKYDHDARRNQNNNNSHDFAPNGEKWSSKEPKYNKRGQTHDHRSHHEYAEDHHDPEKDDRHFHEHKSYKNQHWRKDHHHKDARDHSHQDQYNDQKYSHGKYRPEPRYDPSLTDGDEDTEVSYRHEHKNQWKKHDKDAIGDHYRASQVHYEGHEDHEHKRHGGHGEIEYHDRSGRRSHSKPHYEQHDDNRHKHQDNYKRKSFYDKQDDRGHDHHQENYKHRSYYDNRHKPHHDKQDGSRNKPYYDKPDDNRHKNFHDKQDNNRYKHHHDKQEDYKHRPYDKQEDYEHKHHHHDKRDKPDYDHKHHRDQYDDGKHRSNYGKHSQGSYHNDREHDEDQKHEDVENRHGSSYHKQDHHHRGHKK